MNACSPPPGLAPLADLWVLEAGDCLAARFCGRLLAQLGADVRTTSAPDENALDLFLNQDKRRLQAFSDCPSWPDFQDYNIVLGGVHAFGRPLSRLAESCPDLLVVSVGPYGMENLGAADGMPEALVQAASGLMLLTGLPQRPPLPLYGPQSSFLAGLYAATAIVSRVLQEGFPRGGGYLEISSLEALTSMLLPALAAPPEWLGREFRHGNRRYGKYPDHLLPCRDGCVGIMLGGAADWDRFVQFTDIPGFRDPLLADEAVRVSQADDLDSILTSWLNSWDRSQFVEEAQAWRLPVAACLMPEEVLRDEQNRARCLFDDAGIPRLPFLWNSLRPGCSGEVADPSRRPSLSRGVSFKKLRILDLTTMWAGPLATRVLGDLGADVIKIETGCRPDGMRLATQCDPPSGRSGPVSWFDDLNRNKLSLRLDLSSPEGRAIFLQLVRQADAVVENFTPRVMANFGLNHRVLSGVNPRIVMLSISAYGASGPWTHYAGYGPAVEWASGYAALNRYPDTGPVRAGVAYADGVGGVFGALALLAGLIESKQRSHSVRIDLALRECLSQMFGQVFVALGSGMAAPVPARAILQPGRERGQWWVTCGGIGTTARRPSDILEDESLHNRGFLKPAVGGKQRTTLPWTLDGRRPDRYRPAPSLGKDEDVILGRLLQLTASQVQALRVAGTVA